MPSKAIMSKLVPHIVLAKGRTKFLQDSNGTRAAQLLLVHETALAEINKVIQKKRSLYRKHNAAALSLKQATKFYVYGA